VVVRTGYSHWSAGITRRSPGTPPTRIAFQLPADLLRSGCAVFTAEPRKETSIATANTSEG